MLLAKTNSAITRDWFVAMCDSPTKGGVYDTTGRSEVHGSDNETRLRAHAYVALHTREVTDNMW